VTTAGRLRALHFTVELEPDPADPVTGHAHVAVYPPAYDSEEQIPSDILLELTNIMEWHTLPGL
jgi:hypothetical protein